MFVFAVSFAVLLKEGSVGDYATHTQTAEHIFAAIAGGDYYPMWHLGVWFLSRLGIPLYYSCVIFSSLVTVAVFLSFCFVLNKMSGTYSEWVAAGLCFVTALYIPWYNSEIYLGQGSPVTWHNPTNLMVKPFAIIGFYLITLICRKIRASETVYTKEYGILSVLIFLGVLAKPSFFQGIVPGLGLYIILCLIVYKGAGCKEYIKLCLTFVPGFLVCVAEFVSAFFHGEQGEGIGIGFGATAIYTPNMAVSLLLVIFFPLLYSVLNFKSSFKEVDFQLVWLYTLASWMESAFLYEKGPRMYHGNFGWACLLAYAILFMVTSGRLLCDLKNMNFANKKEVTKNTVLLVTWLLHLLCGLYYVQQLITVEGKWL